MSFIYTEQIYTVRDKTSVWFREGDIYFDEADVIVDEDDLSRPFYVQNVQENDLAVTLALEVPDPFAAKTSLQTLSFLVVAASEGTGIIIPGHVVDQSPRQWCSPYLEGLIRGLEPTEFDQFTLAKLASYVTARSGN